MTFKNDEERREYFRNELRKKLPELKKIEGFPIGDDEDIIALSDPPYYTACPNPWINDFIEEWEREKKEKYGRDENEEYHREPFATDVSEGKSDKLYKLHSYHTKVPHKAIARYILHYTKPGDIVLDGFAGSGMTGVATQLSSDREFIKSLGYRVEEDGKILDESNQYISEIGARKSILIDLSPTASLISSNYNHSINKNVFIKEAQEVMIKLKEKCSWMFQTSHGGDTKLIGYVNYTVWSEVFICPYCSKEFVFWNEAVDKEKMVVKDTFNCPNCQAKLSKKSIEKLTETYYDEGLKQITKQPKRVPVLINYSFNGERYDKTPDESDLELLKKIDQEPINEWYPTNLMMNKEGKWGDTWRAGTHLGITHVHHFFNKRTLKVMSEFYSLIRNKKYYFVFQNILRGSISYSTKMVKVNVPRLLSKGGIFSFGAVTGTLYIPSLNGERNLIDAIESKINSYIKYVNGNFQNNNVVVSTQSTGKLQQIKSESIDYVFVDPPFGSNLMYSELNFIYEGWMKVFTNNKTEAIINNEQNKTIIDYLELITQCFKEIFRVLKPGRWMTVEFSNSQSSVWNTIQEAIQKAGFIIANVSVLDKKQGSFKAVTSTTAVKQDLVISAYKPKTEHVEKMRQEQNTEESAWTFVRQHLEQLPVFIGHKGEAQIIAERTPRILFDRMVAYHVQNGLPVPISSAEFQAKVAQRFPMRDGMVFLESQVAEYDKKRTLVKEFVQMSLFVTDETSAIEWLRQQLLKKPQTRQDLHPNFMKEIQHIAKHEKLPELDDLLEQNFLKYEGDGPVPDQIASYLRRNYKDLRGLENDDPRLKEKAMNRWYVPDPNKQADLEKLREKALLREFEGYVEELSKSKKKLKQFRTEAIRAGFKKAWSEKDYETIVKVGERLPESVIQEDDKLLMYYDNAQIRLGM